MTTGQILLLIMLVVGIGAFFGIGIWGINRLRNAESDHNIHKHS